MKQFSNNCKYIFQNFIIMLVLLIAFLLFSTHSLVAVAATKLPSSVNMNQDFLDIHRNIQGENLTESTISEFDSLAESWFFEKNNTLIKDTTKQSKSATGATGYIKSSFYLDGCSSKATLVSITSLGVCSFTSNSLYGHYFIATLLNTTSNSVKVQNQYYSESSCSKKLQTTLGSYSLYRCSSSHEYSSQEFSTTYPSTILDFTER
jgi:hypothetical protein